MPRLCCKKLIDSPCRKLAVFPIITHQLRSTSDIKSMSVRTLANIYIEMGIAHILAQIKFCEIFIIIILSNG